MTGKLKLYFSNLMRKKVQTVLIVISIAIGICAVTVIGSIGKIGQHEIEKEINSMGVGSFMINIETKINPDITISEDDLKTIRTVSGVTGTSPIIVEYTQTSMCGLVGISAVWGIDSGEEQFVPLKLLYGRLFTPEDIDYSRQVCVLDQNMALTYFKRENVVGKVIEVAFLNRKIEFEVVGIVESGGNVMQNALESVVPAFLYLPYTTVQNFAGHSGYNRVAVEVGPTFDVEAVTLNVTEQLATQNGNLPDVYKTQNISEQKRQLNNILDIVTLILSAVAGISIVVAAMGIAIVMMVTVSERTKEIGIKKAIGAKNSEILLEFLFEAFLLSLLGTAIGFLLGTSIVFMCCVIIKTPFILNGGLILTATGITVLMGVLSGAYPAKVAADMHPVDALRYE